MAVSKINSQIGVVDSSGNVTVIYPYTSATNVEWSGKIGNTNVTNVGDALTQLNSNEFLLKKIFPVGSLYFNINNTNPSTFIGGTWVLVETGRFIRSISSGTGGAVAGTNINTGGTTLSSNHIPSHTHGVGTLAAASANAAHTHTFYYQWAYRPINDGSLRDNEYDRPITNYMGSNDLTQYPSYLKGVIPNANAPHSHSISGATGAWGASSPSSHNHTITGDNLVPKHYTCYIFRRTA